MDCQLSVIWQHCKHKVTQHIQTARDSSQAPWRKAGTLQPARSIPIFPALHVLCVPFPSCLFTNAYYCGYQCVCKILFHILFVITGLHFFRMLFFVATVHHKIICCLMWQFQATMHTTPASYRDHASVKLFNFYRPNSVPCSLHKAVP